MSTNRRDVGGSRPSWATLAYVSQIGASEPVWYDTEETAREDCRELAECLCSWPWEPRDITEDDDYTPPRLETEQDTALARAIDEAASIEKVADALYQYGVERADDVFVPAD